MDEGMFEILNFVLGDVLYIFVRLKFGQRLEMWEEEY